MKSTESTRRCPRAGGSLQRLLIWIMILTCWEGAYRIIGWRPWLFPAPSHVLDATLEMLGVETAFGDPLSTHWPKMPTDANAPPEKAPPVYRSPLVSAIGSSVARLIAGFAAALAIG